MPFERAAQRRVRVVADTARDLGERLVFQLLVKASILRFDLGNLGIQSLESMHGFGREAMIDPALTGDEQGDEEQRGKRRSQESPQGSYRRSERIGEACRQQRY